MFQIVDLLVSLFPVLSSTLLYCTFILLSSEDIEEILFGTYILIDYQSGNLDLTLNMSRIKMIFDKNPGQLLFQPAADCELVCTIAECISTVVADYILCYAPERDLDLDRVMPLLLLYCKI